MEAKDLSKGSNYVFNEPVSVLGEMYSVCKEFSFDAAHRLHLLPYDSKCKNVHGHKYFITLRLFSEKLNNGMIIDFTHFKEFSEWIDYSLDHSMLIAENDTELVKFCENLKTKYTIVPCEMTTSENLARYIQGEANKLYGQLCESIEVIVYETPKNYASYESFTS
jgi:6-pyruvoyltetrahydropterin/6-carboxytetrahydropterin synthase